MSVITMDLDKDFESTLQDTKKELSYDYFKIEGIQPKQLDFVKYIKNFVDSNNIADESVDGTSNQGSKDIVSLIKDISKPTFKLVALNKIYVKLYEKYNKTIADNWLRSQILGKAYLHDAHSSTFMPYCYAYDLTKLATEGLFFLETNSKIPYNAQPAKHLDTFINHIKEFVSFTSNRQAGAVGLANIMPFLYYFWKNDVKNGYNGCAILSNDKLGIEDFGKYDNNNQNIKYFKQCVQSLIYVLNQPYVRDSVQSAFTNVSIFDHYYAHSLFDGMTFPDGSLAYYEIDNIINLQVIFMDVIAEIREVNMFTFPVLTFSLLTLKDENNKFIGFADEEFARWASKHNTKWFDSNFYLSDKVTALSNCCRLISNIQNNTNNLGYFNSIGGSGLSVGSIKVNTINLAYFAYEATINSDNNYQKWEEKYLSNLKDQVILNLQVLDVIRNIIIDNKNKRKLLPNICDGLIDLKHMYNTIGVIGIYEVLRHFQNKLNSYGLDNDVYIKVDGFGNTYYLEHAEKFVKEIFNTIHQTIKEFKTQHNLDYSINIEQIPAESAAQKLMQKDILTFGLDKVVTDLPMYGNQFIPLGIKTTMEERVRVAALFDKYLNGGSICHMNYESTFDEDKHWELLNWIAQEELVYSAFTTKISACKHNHGFFGKICPVCGEPAVTSYARIVGFYTATGITPDNEKTNYGSWSTARQEEFRLRQWD